jgi:hypothetical protein
MSSTLAVPRAAAPDRLIGDQRPRIFSAPPSVSSAGVEAVELAASAGLVLDPWQAWLLEQGLAEQSDGRWAAFEVAMLLSRQNGKGGVLEAVALAGLYLFGDRFIGWSAHEFKTCQEGFRRVLGLIEGSDDLRRRVKRVRTSHGEEGIELLGGQRLRFMARSTGSGRGFSGQRLILDEAQHLGEAAIEAVLPTMSAQPNPQVWYAATAPDPEIAPCGVLARLRRRALRGKDRSLVYAEWSADVCDHDCAPDCAEHDQIGDPCTWARANPALGIRISAEHVEREMAAMGLSGFLRERLGVGRWPVEGGAWEVVGEEAWDALSDLGSEVVDPVCLAAAVTPAADYGAVAAVGRRPDGLLHVEIVEHRARTSWIPGRLVELAAEHQPCATVVASVGADAMLIPALVANGFVRIAPAAAAPATGQVLLAPYAREIAQGAGMFRESVTDARTLRHLGQAELAVALAGAVKRDLAGAWGWGRRDTTVDLSPLQAASEALWGFAVRSPLTGPPGEKRYFLDLEASP